MNEDFWIESSRKPYRNDQCVVEKHIIQPRQLVVKVQVHISNGCQGTSTYLNGCQGTSTYFKWLSRNMYKNVNLSRNVQECQLVVYKKTNWLSRNTYIITGCQGTCT